MLRKRETLFDRLYRYRGVAFVALFPAAIIILIILFVPRVPSGGSDVNPTDLTYSVVFDAGSTGSRVHIFTFKKTKKGIDLVSDTFEQLKPGLGDAGWAAEPQRAADSLQPLLEKAKQTVPPEAQASTPIELRATAGLRLLPGSQAQDILNAVTQMLQASPFKLVKGGVTILDGSDEGAYSWVTLNYLLGNLGKPYSKLVGVIDLGGGSVQQAFAIADDVAAEAPEGYVKKLSGNGQTYNVYVYSYLGYGLMQGRGAVLSRPDGKLCVNKGSTGIYKSPYGGAEYSIAASEEGSNYDGCNGAVEGALKLGEACSTKQQECSFNGAWGGAANHQGRKFYLMSYFFDRAIDAGIIKDKNAISQDATPNQYAVAAKTACKDSVEQIPQSFASVPADGVPYLCLDLSFQHSLLTDGMKLDNSAPVTVAKQIRYNGQDFEAAWPLGAAINTLSST